MLEYLFTLIEYAFLQHCNIYIYVSRQDSKVRKTFGTFLFSSYLYWSQKTNTLIAYEDYVMLPFSVIEPTQKLCKA